MILAVSNGEYDMAADGITITEERAEIVDFSDGYVSLEQVLLSRVGEDRFTTVEEFVANEELTLGVQPGTTNFFVAQDLLGEGSERIVAYETFPVAVQALIAEDVDAVIMDDVAGQGYVGVNADRVQITGEPLTAEEELGFIFPPGSELREAVNAALESMRRDGTLLEFNLIWFAGVEPEAE
jgi:polar amino acid transport system substrate-binding protein